MNKDSEKFLEKELKRRIEEQGGLCIKFLPFNTAGLPDRIVLISGLVFFVELKSKGKKLRPVQRIVHKMFLDVGHSVWVVDSEETLEDVLNYIKLRISETI